MNFSDDGHAAVARFTKILNDRTLPDGERYAAAFELAKLFREGRAVPRSDTAAIKYFTLAARADVVTARVAYNALAKIFSDAEPVNVDMMLHWLTKAVEVGSNSATWTLAKIFRDGSFGVTRDGYKALEILRVPASKNFDAINKPIALRMMAEIFDKGLGVPVDKAKAAALYREADSIRAEWIHAVNSLQVRA